MQLNLLRVALQVVGILQIALCAGSLLIPKLLDWKGELLKVKPLIRQIFWTYAGYILITNLCFGLLSVLAPDSLLDRSVLAICVSGYIAVYWITRILIQFFYFDRKSAPEGAIYKLGEIALVVLFIFLSVCYSLVFLANLRSQV